ALVPVEKRYIQARKNSSGALRDALTKLHGILDADQRGAFVEALECRLHAMFGATAMHERMEKWSKELGLSDDQKQQFRTEIDKITPVLKKERDTGRQMLEAFRGDSFSIEQFFPASETEQRAHEKVQRVAGFVEVMIRILTPEQREKAAEKIRDFAEKGHKGK